MRRIIVESPYQGKSPEERARNIRYARAAVRDALMRGETPLCSHLLFTQPGILKDWIVDEWIKGMQAGWNWYHAADAVIAYVDFGTSSGMSDGIALAVRMEIPVETRRIPEWEDANLALNGIVW